MTPKFSKADAFRTTDKIVSLGNSYESQYVIRGLEKIGEYEGVNYWNCFDIYEANGIRFFQGEGCPQLSESFNSIVKLCGKEIDNKCRGWSEEDVQKRKGLIEALCNNIKAGRHDPSKVTSFGNFKKQLVEQKKLWPDKSFISISKELLAHVPLLYPYTRTEEIKDKINSGINAEINRLSGPGFNELSYETKLGCALQNLYTAQLKKEEKALKKEKEPEISR